MALVLADRVKDTTTTTGTGTVTLSGTAPSGFQNFSVVGNGNTTYYTLVSGSAWEVGIGTYSSTGPTLSRDTVLSSSASGSKITLSGTSDVFVTLPSERVGVLYTPVKTSNYNANVQDGVQTNTTGGAFTVTLPASPAAGDQVVVVDSAGTWATNNLTIGRNGSTIEGLAENLVCNISGVSVQLIYSGTTWDVYVQAGGAGASVISVAGGGTGAATFTGSYLLKGNGTSPITSSVIYDNGTNVGVGTATPGSKFTTAGVIESTTGGFKFPDATTQTSAATAVNVQEFTSSGTWTKPSGAAFVLVEIWGAGGGGSSGRRGANPSDKNGGCGGGGGSYNYRLFKASDLASTVAVTIGAGGTGGAAVTVNDTNGNNGTNGGTSSFGTIMYAYGGGLGGNGTQSAGAGAGTFSSASGTTPGGPVISGNGQFGGAGDTGGAPAGGYSSNFGGGNGGNGGVSFGYSYRSGGGASIFGGAGGGGGGAISGGGGSPANTVYPSEAGGSTVFGVIGGAAGATTGAAGTAGAFRCGGGGGYAGDVSGTVAGGAGGNGGAAAGGGGGGCSTNGANSGKGGDGGNGYCRISTW